MAPFLFLYSFFLLSYIAAYGPGRRNCKLTQRFSIKTVTLPGGERLPILQDRLLGLPDYDGNAFAVVELRPRHLAANTIEQALRSVMVLKLALEHLEIDLDARVDQGKTLTVGEVDAIAHACQLPLARLDEMAAATRHRTHSVAAKVVSLERARMKGKARSVEANSASTVGVRIYYAAEYLSWYFKRKKVPLDLHDPRRRVLENAEDDVVSALKERAPPHGRSNLGKPEGLTKAEMDMLLEVSEPDSPRNPWTTLFIRIRNALLVRLMVKTGIRKGELGGIYVSDVDFRRGSLLIARRPDAPDPRKKKPNAKTRDRVIPLGQDLLRMAQDYVLNHRRSILGARRHEFLFVAEDTGAPLSLSAIDLVFIDLRTKCPDMPAKLHPHLMRHTFNERLSEEADSKGWSDEEERKVRIELNGWSERSKTASVYTRRRVREKAREASLGLQKKLED